ncbi:DUF6086 family protein [Streptomyces olivoreticuli]
MSQYFSVGDETLWNPSNGASRMFLHQVAVFEVELDVTSGLGPMEADECQVDPAAFAAFTDALLAWHRKTHHAVILALSEGFVATVLALAGRAGAEVRWTPPEPDPGEGLRDVQAGPAVPAAVDDEAWRAGLRAKSRELDRFMAR